MDASAIRWLCDEDTASFFSCLGLIRSTIGRYICIHDKFWSTPFYWGGLYYPSFVTAFPSGVFFCSTVPKCTWSMTFSQGWTAPPKLLAHPVKLCRVFLFFVYVVPMCTRRQPSPYFHKRSFLTTKRESSAQKWGSLAS